MTDQRAAIRSNAKYLRNVRPVDPEEICEYVEGQPHPAVVRQTLREEAFDLGLVEREDGTFVPVDDEPARPAFHGVTSFPDAYARELEDLLVERYGAGWPEGESGDALRETIRKLKDAYYRQHPVEYDAEAALAYAVYHLPDYYAAVQYVLAELAEEGLLPRTLRVLDVGAGVGGPALGLHDFLPDDALVDYHAVEPSASADVLEQLLDGTRRNFRTTVHRDRAEEFDLKTDGSAGDGDDWDLILFANVLNELDDPEGTARSYLDALAEDGSLVALAPADKNTSAGLRAVERSLTDDAAVFSPTVRLWPHEEPDDAGWSFTVKPDLDAPAFQRRLDEAATDPEHEPGEFVNVDVQYSHAILRPDGRRKIDYNPDPSRFAKMAEMDAHVTDRIDLVALKLSHDLSGPDANPLFKVSDGSEGVDHYAVLTKETTLNADLRTAEYGDLLTFDGALALWNDDEGAYNLVIDEETVVERVPV
ncbi:class I SAM-dependent methyltransferase [Halostella sp. JP-L12]|uniref:small ribosomal subunit Rsm22 family protein n=1 Tax=Halostella TaxID=1843185 RepID=UPI000EF75A86|nr:MULTISPECIES: class I SAM-dependent methyltransferase [Halostella]NHN49573.1 class I SAM-dependent methyltransferase [Halostella sp. JP-L12]